MKTLRHEQCWKCKKFEMEIRGTPGSYYVKTLAADTTAMFGVACNIPITFKKLSQAEEKFRGDMDAHKGSCKRVKHSLGYKPGRSAAVTKTNK